ncbi:malectin-like [Penaeus chinensis]|uniref:malectin-like n=1 Tax=Penaeus chinensis TaxID=139456 RepID=UPI001FB7E0B8|nr:malectin-like [Penaeus chinensis]
MENKRYIHSLLLLLTFIAKACGLGEVIYAVNAGECPLQTYNKLWERLISVLYCFQILYQTERYHHSTFGYEIPLKGDGDYVLVLKFSEVYFNAPDQKVFDVSMNGDLTVIPALDIFGRVGRGVAHDEYVPFTIAGNTLIVGGQETTLRGSKLRVDFVKGYRDNPKVNAIFVIKGRLDDVPKLQPLPREEDLDNDIEEPRPNTNSLNQNANNQNNKQQSTAKRRPSGPRTPDPYASDDTSSMLPVFVAIGAAVPILFCLCKL